MARRDMSGSPVLWLGLLFSSLKRGQEDTTAELGDEGQPSERDNAGHAWVGGGTGVLIALAVMTHATQAYLLCPASLRMQIELVRALSRTRSLHSLIKANAV